MMNSLIDTNLLYYNDKCIKFIKIQMKVVIKIKINFIIEFNFFNNLNIPLETKKHIFKDHSVIFKININT